MIAETWQELGITLRRTHGQHHTDCPHCEGRSKSLSVDPEKGLYCCHRCDFSGRMGVRSNWLDGQLERIEKANQERDKAREQAARNAQSLWSRAARCMWHEYLKQKRVLPCGIRQKDQLLVIPMYDADGRLRNCQTIDRDGRKLFLRGGITKGLYYPIQGDTEQVYICEGFATGATLHQVFYKYARIAVAFNAGNLLPVAVALRTKYPDARLVIAADNDQWTVGNPGMTKAKAAADAVGAKVVYPKFCGYDTKDQPTDFNDLYLLRRKAAI